jgi:Na+/H+-dicarboxylate symporter
LSSAMTQPVPETTIQVAGSNLLLAFSTSSASAIMPMTIQTSHQLGVPENVTYLVIPPGATMNMADSGTTETVAPT